MRGLLLRLIALSSLLLAGEARAADNLIDFTARERTEIEFIQDLNIKDPYGENMFLGRKIHMMNFIVPYSLTDEGYVLAARKRTGVVTYDPLGADKIKELQAKGLLPNPLPPYRLWLLDLVRGHALWIVIAMVLLVFAGTVFHKTDFSAGPSKTLRIGASRLKMLALLPFGLLLIAYSANRVYERRQETAPDTVSMAIGGLYGVGGIIAILFALGSLLQNRPIMVLSPEGFHDRRLSRDIIPWRDLQEITPKTVLGMKTLVLTVSPACLKTLRLVGMPRFRRLFGAKLLHADLSSLNVDAKKLHEAIAIYKNGAAGGTAGSERQFS